MSKSSLKFLGFAVLAIFISGCTARTYTQVKDRVDQNMATGNAGYLYGAPPQEDRSNLKKTRKTYVLEIETKDRKAKEEAAVEVKSKPKPTVEVSEESPRVRRAPIVIPPELATPEETQPAANQPEAATNPGEYKVEKGDTLQKISKKFYDTYRLWNKIYEANKDKIKNPNSIRPGTVLTIPPK